MKPRHKVLYGTVDLRRPLDAICQLCGLKASDHVRPKPKSKPKSKPADTPPGPHDNFYTTPITTSPPAYGSPGYTRLQQWLNIQHAGRPDVPKKALVDAAHEQSHWALARDVRGTLKLQLQQDGSSIPLELEYGGHRYRLGRVP